MNGMRRAGLGLSALATLFFAVDAVGKLLEVEPVLRGTVELGWPVTAVVPLGVLLLIGTILYAVPRTALLGAVYLTAFLGGAVATHYRIGSPLGTHVLFGVYVAIVMWAGLLLRDPALLELAWAGLGSRHSNRDRIRSDRAHVTPGFPSTPTHSPSPHPDSSH
jgi:hypothetical protein